MALNGARAMGSARVNSAEWRHTKEHNAGRRAAHLSIRSAEQSNCYLSLLARVRSNYDHYREVRGTQRINICIRPRAAQTRAPRTLLIFASAPAPVVVAKWRAEVSPLKASESKCAARAPLAARVHAPRAPPPRHNAHAAANLRALIKSRGERASLTVERTRRRHTHATRVHSLTHTRRRGHCSLGTAPARRATPWPPTAHNAAASRTHCAQVPPLPPARRLHACKSPERAAPRRAAPR